MTQKTIVITRPKGDEDELREELLALGHRVICEPLTEIFLRHTVRMEVENALEGDPDAVIITSKHAVQALAMLTELRDVFLLCVGAATKELAEDLGFFRVSLAGETADGMLDYITDCYDEDARFLHISGEDIRVDWREVLGSSGMEVTRIVAYEAIAAEALSDTLVEQLKRGQIDAVSFFSPRAAEIFLELTKKAGILDTLTKIDAFCLSANIAVAAAQGEWKNIKFAEQPTLASLVVCVDNGYK